MGKPGPQTTDVTDFARAVPTFRVKGRAPLRYRILTTIAEVKQALREGRLVHLCIHYGVFNREAFRTGDPSFAGGHSVAILGHRIRDGVAQVHLYDPLDDSRRQGIPQGPRWIARDHLVKAAEAFAGARGRCWAGVFTGGRPTGGKHV
jgi:hypothetical protein